MLNDIPLGLVEKVSLLINYEAGYKLHSVVAGFHGGSNYCSFSIDSQDELANYVEFCNRPRALPVLT